MLLVRGRIWLSGLMKMQMKANGRNKMELEMKMQEDGMKSWNKKMKWCSWNEVVEEEEPEADDDDDDISKDKIISQKGQKRKKTGSAKLGKARK